MPLTDDERSIVQGLIAISDDETVMTDATLDLLFTQAGNIYGTAQLAIYMILADTAKRNAYTIGQTSEQAQQAFDNLYKLAGKYEKLADAGVQPSGAQIVGMRSVPPPMYTLPGNASGYGVSYPYGRRWRCPPY